MYNLEEHIATSFPMQEKYTDCAGIDHLFEISVRSLPVGYVVEARELSDGPYGYEFTQSAEVHPFDALGTIRKRIRRALSQRFLTYSRGEVSMATDLLAGTISNLGLVVDGKLVPWSDLQRMLSTCEGFPIAIQIGD